MVAGGEGICGCEVGHKIHRDWLQLVMVNWYYIGIVSFLRKINDIKIYYGSWSWGWSGVWSYIMSGKRLVRWLAVWHVWSCIGYRNYREGKKGVFWSYVGRMARVAVYWSYDRR